MKLAGIYTAILLLLLTGCTESTTVGGEILDEDQSALLAIDTITIRTATTMQEELVVSSPELQSTLTNYLCGHFGDPIFGPVKADFYAQFRVNEVALPAYPDTATFDSLVLILELNLDGIYGDSTATHEFEIYRITTDPVDTDSAYVSGNVLPIESTPLATVTFTPDYTERIDSTTIESIDNTVTPADTTYVTITPSFSIRLDDLIDDLVTINTEGNDQNNEDFLANFGGLAIRPVGGPTESMLSFNIGSIATGLQLHYHTEENGDVDNFLYEYNITTASVRFSSFEHEFNPAIIAAEADGFEGGKTQTYLQGMNGPNTVVELPYITDFKDEVLVNHAELTVTVQETPDATFFPPVTQIIILYKNQEGDFVTIEDFLFTANGVGLSSFGGQPESFTGSEGELLTRYRMKISGHLQRMISGELPNEIYLRVFQKTEIANRVVLFGSEHPQYPVTLKANFTNLN